LLTRRRAGQTALLGARGASRAQVARRGLADAAVVAVPAILLGPLAGAALLSSLGRGAAAWPGGGLWPAAWLAGGLVAAAGVGVIAVPWLRRPRSPLRQRASRGRSLAAAAYARADLVVIVVAAGAVWQLLRSTGPVAVSQSGTLSADPILVIAPVLALAGAALLTLRVLPVAARLSDRLAARSRGVTGAAAAWQLSRRALREAGPTLITVLAVAAAVLAFASRASWQRSVHAQASFQVGADARVTLPSSAELPPGQAGAITAAPGVTASSPAVRQSLSLPGGASGTLLALDTAAAARIIPPDAGGPRAGVLRGLAVTGPAGVRLPGHPVALRFTVRAARSALGPLGIAVSLSDAAGVAYSLPAGSVRPDGRPHRLRVSIGGGRADYPLRVTGYSVEFPIPFTRRAAQRLTISAAETVPGGAGGPARFPAAAAGPFTTAATQGTGGTDPVVLRAGAQAGALAITFSPGVYGSAIRQQGVSAGAAQISVTDAAPPAGRLVPAVVTRRLLAATGLRVGDRMQVTAGNTTIGIIPVAAVRFLPGGAGSAVLVDQRTLAAALAARGAPPEPVTQWWLRTSGRLRLGPLPAGTTVLTRRRLTSQLLADPLAAAAQAAQLAIAAAAVLLALLALLIGALTADRSRDLALLDALGMPPGQIARMLAVEQALAGVATAAVGLVVGYLLTRLIVPADTLTAQAARPVPPLAVHVPWLAAVAVAVVIAAVPTAAILLAPPRAGRGAAMIRTEAPA
ncbi:MAG TPA: ABC transporter permease, partial [Streptosporangiaceae bacterium]